MGFFAAKWAATKLLFGKVPRWVWLTLLVVTLVVGAVWLHQRHANAMLEAAYEQGQKDRDAAWQTRFDEMQAAANDWKTKYEQASATLANERRQRHEETLRHNAELADALRLSGPGRASAARCRPIDNSGLSGASGGDGSTPSDPNAPGPGVPEHDGDAIVPWGWLVRRGEEHDALLSEVVTWRSWYAEQKDLFEQEVRELPVPEFGQE